MRTEPYWKASIAKAVATRITNQRARARASVRIEGDEAHVFVAGSLAPMRVNAADAELVRNHSWFIDNGYARAKVNHRMVRAHRLIMDAQPGECLDHVNGNRLDNRRINLRFATPAENNRNRGLSSNSATGIAGVNQRPSGNFRAQIKRGDYRWSETFATELTAALARDRKLAQLDGWPDRAGFPRYASFTQFMQKMIELAERTQAGDADAELRFLTYYNELQAAFDEQAKRSAEAVQ